jgi:hypothetical protein
MVPMHHEMEQTQLCLIKSLYFSKPPSHSRLYEPYGSSNCHLLVFGESDIQSTAATLCVSRNRACIPLRSIQEAVIAE